MSTTNTDADVPKREQLSLEQLEAESAAAAGSTGKDSSPADSTEFTIDRQVPDKPSEPESGLDQDDEEDNGWDSDKEPVAPEQRPRGGVKRPVVAVIKPRPK
ncbi:hypothetical protein BDP27DRAFT_1310115 [Rhodocollybia butyracea]|uniref:Uncharacterized protein n=1 Tax=Rhodocollybia butyracea TaxID=206335 RepID=A0A9P5QCD5_9AGAR|nr:hypothetical protein BDP27DRAFT_1310115 [Rhodocollybia butyracea]